MSTLILNANIDGHVTINLTRVEHIYSVRIWEHSDTPPRWLEVYTGPDKEKAIEEYFVWQSIKLECVV